MAVKPKIDKPVGSARDKRTIWTLRAILVILIIIIILLLLRRCGGSPSGVVLEPDYAQLPTETNAVEIGDKDDEKLEAPQGGGSVALVYSDQVTLDLAAGTVGLYYQNPSRSTQNVVVQVVVNGSGDDKYLLAQSGVLEPGYMVTSLELNKDSGVTLSAGGYSGSLKLLFYDPETGERAIVDTDIPITITVK